MKGSKGQFNALAAAGLGIVTFAIILATGALVLTQYQSTDIVTANSTADNILDSGLEGVQVGGDMTPVVAIAVIAMVVIGLFAYRKWA